MGQINLFILSAAHISVAGLKNVLKPVKKIVILGCSDNLEKTFQFIKEKPTIILFIEDTYFDKEELLRFLDLIISARFKVILFTDSNDSRYLTEIINKGIRGILHKAAPKDKIIDSILLIYAGGIYIDHIINLSLSMENVKNKIKSDYLGKLSKREIEVLKLISTGLKNSEVAEKLVISYRTIEAHKTHLIKKLNLKNSAHLSLFAFSIKEELNLY